MSFFSRRTILLSLFALLLGLAVPALADEVISYRDADGKMQSARATSVERVEDGEGKLTRLKLVLGDGSEFEIYEANVVSRVQVDPLPEPKPEPAEGSEPESDEGSPSAAESSSSGESSDQATSDGESVDLKAAGGLRITPASDASETATGMMPELVEGGWWERESGKVSVQGTTINPDGTTTCTLRDHANFASRKLVKVNEGGYTIYAWQSPAGMTPYLIEPLHHGMRWESTGGPAEGVVAQVSLEADYRNAADTQHEEAWKIELSKGERTVATHYFAQGLGRVSGGFVAWHPPELEPEQAPEDPKDPEDVEAQPDAGDESEASSDAEASEADSGEAEASTEAGVEAAEATETEGVEESAEGVTSADAESETETGEDASSQDSSEGDGAMADAASTEEDAGTESTKADATLPVPEDASKDLGEEGSQDDARDEGEEDSRPDIYESIDD